MSNSSVLNRVKPLVGEARHRALEGCVVIATHNSGKLAEMRELLAPFGIEAVSAGELGLPVPAETGHMFCENAAIKAHAAATATGMPALSDDSGLCVDALDGAPRPVFRRLGRAQGLPTGDGARRA